MRNLDGKEEITIGSAMHTIYPTKRADWEYALEECEVVCEEF